jgi:hypothetical protein
VLVVLTADTIGQYTSPETASDECTLCSVGRYSLGIGAVSCELCPMGKHSGVGAVVCIGECADGSQPQVLPTDVPSECPACPVGLVGFGGICDVQCDPGEEPNADLT